MIIRNIVLKDLLEVLNSMPKNTKMIRIEYTEHNSKMVVFPSEEEDDDEEEDDSPHISPDDDLTNYI